MTSLAPPPDPPERVEPERRVVPLHITLKIEDGRRALQEFATSPPPPPMPVRADLGIFGLIGALPHGVTLLIRLAFWATLLIGLLGLIAVHAQGWTNTPNGNGTTYLDGTDGRWHGTQYAPNSSGTVYTDLYGADGQAKHCTTHRPQGGSTTFTYTDCH